MEGSLKKTTEEKALDWFWGDAVQGEKRDKVMNDGFVSLEKIVNMFIQRHPWEKEDQESK